MRVFLFNDAEKTKYETFLAAERGSFLQSWQWGEFQASQDQKVLRFAMDDENQLKLVGQFIEQTIPHLGGKYLYCPYGPVGDLKLISEFISQLQKQFPDYWFVRIEPQIDFPKVGQKTLRIQPGKTLVTDLTKPEQNLLAGLHGKTRYNIKVAQKHSVQISALTADDARAATALTLISTTSTRQGFTDHPQSYYQSLLKTLASSTDKLQLKIYTAYYQDKLLNCAAMLDYNDTRTYLFGGSGEEYKNVMAPYLLHWQAIQDAKLAGLKYYDWWGIETASGKTPGFARFKLGWIGEQISYPAPQDVVNKPVYYLIYKLLRTINRLF